YSGDFINDEFDGEGTLTFPDGGTFIGKWKRGIAIDGRYVFGDGLDFEDKDWGYLNNGDRRFYDEVKHGIRPAGASLLTNDPKGPPKIPKGCYDVGNGYFDPVENKTFSYDGSRMIGKPGEEEIKWIKNTVM
ncbi:MORN repeat-containing protein 5, partial [Perkinsus olseni]